MPRWLGLLLWGLLVVKPVGAIGSHALRARRLYAEEGVAVSRRLGDDDDDATKTTTKTKTKSKIRSNHDDGDDDGDDADDDKRRTTKAVPAPTHKVRRIAHSKKTCPVYLSTWLRLSLSEH